MDSAAPTCTPSTPTLEILEISVRLLEDSRTPASLIPGRMHTFFSIPGRPECLPVPARGMDSIVRYLLQVFPPRTREPTTPAAWSHSESITRTRCSRIWLTRGFLRWGDRIPECST